MFLLYPKVMTFDSSVPPSMGPSSATQRKNKPAPSPSSLLAEVPNETSTVHPSRAPPSTVVSVAEVRRRRCGTSPFDKHWLNLDCCGLFCAGLTYMLHIYGCYAVCAILIPPWMSSVGADGVRRMSIGGIINCIAFCFVAVLASLSHFKAMTTDPGAVPPDAAPLPDPEQDEETSNLLESGNGANADASQTGSAPPPRRPRKLCRRCNAFKPPRAHHCSICRRCIIKMDHHCPWVNNCVGIGNHKYFLLFIFYTCLSCIYSISLLAMRFFICINLKRGRRCLNEPTDLLPIVGLVVEAMLFGLFTSCMMIDQWDVVMTNVTHIDRLKGEIFFDTLNPTRKPATTGINEVFGARGSREGFRPDWLSPFAKVCFPSSLKDDIMGFCTAACGGGRNGSDSSSKDVEMSGRRIRSGLNEIV